MIGANAEILLVQNDGSLVLQVRDDTPGIANPGLISSFGGHIEEGEEPIDAAWREINEETNLNLSKEQLQFFKKYVKTKEEHGQDWDVYYFVAKDISTDGLEVYEGQGFTVLRDLQEVQQAKTTILLQQVLADYFNALEPQQ